MGEECPRPVASGSEHYIGQVISSRAQSGENLGGEADGKGGVARSSGVCRESRYRQVGAARPPQLCRMRHRRRTCARLCYAAGGELEQIQFLLGHVSIQTTERYLGCKADSQTLFFAHTDLLLCKYSSSGIGIA